MRAPLGSASPKARIKPRDSAPVESRWRTNAAHRGRFAFVRLPDRPPPKRLPVGEPSTSSAPSSVHMGDYGSESGGSSPSGPTFPLFAMFSLHRAQLCVRCCVLYKEPDHGFAESGALSSTSPTDRSLPRQALRGSFVLVASRARRSGNLRCEGDLSKNVDDRKAAICERTAMGWA
jgi:hypothetical protein